MQWTTWSVSFVGARSVRENDCWWMRIDFVVLFFSEQVEIQLFQVLIKVHFFMFLNTTRPMYKWQLPQRDSLCIKFIFSVVIMKLSESTLHKNQFIYYSQKETVSVRLDCIYSALSFLAIISVQKSRISFILEIRSHTSCRFAETEKSASALLSWRATFLL